MISPKDYSYLVTEVSLELRSSDNGDFFLSTWKEREQSSDARTSLFQPRGFEERPWLRRVCACGYRGPNVIVGRID